MITAASAQIRFGLGCTPGTTPADPARWLAQQLADPDPGPQTATVAEAITATMADFAARRMRKQLVADAPPDPSAPPSADRPPSQARALFQADGEALLTHAVTTPAPFRERLVWFWLNHFTVSTRKGMIAPLVGSYVRDAIRPHVTGRFADMLLAVMRHPAMLLYLDNAQSAGPNSPAGVRTNRGLNENLARECLELHTVSPAAGYTQTDVTAFASVLTGWSIERREEPLGFRYRPGMAEPGDKTVLGRSFPAGEQGGVAALQFLADHPATHRHLATKLVTHFVADTPPPDAVRRIETVLRDTGGDLGAASLELTRLPGAWTPFTKFRSPAELVLATWRGAALPAEKRPPLMPILAGLGQPMFGAPLPNGWPDSAAEWAGPEALIRRVDWAYGFAARPELPEPMQLADATFGPLLPAATASAVHRAGSRRDAITLLLASPEFQRR